MNYIFKNEKAKYLELFDYLASLINSNTLKADEKLPSKRDLALDLNVSLNTVINAYALLLDEGYIYSVEKKGYYVTSQPAITTSKKTSPVNDDKKTAFLYDFTTQSTPTYPKDEIKKLYKKALDSDEFITKTPLFGLYELRKAISSHLKENRGIDANPDNILITSGMEGFERILSLIENENLILENPGYHKLEKIGENANKKISYMNLDNEGTLVPSEKGILYTTPFNQFPTGIKMTILRKKELINWALSSNSYIIEDDFDAEFRINSNPTISLYSLNNEKVIFFSTFSTTLYPGLKIAYIILPLNLKEKYERKYKNYSSEVSTVNQMVLSDMINDGKYASLMNRRKKAYLSKRKACFDALDKYHISYDVKRNYLSILITLNTKKTDEEVVQILKENSIHIQAMSEFSYHLEIQHVFILGYTGIDNSRIEEGIQKIALLAE